MGYDHCRYARKVGADIVIKDPTLVYPQIHLDNTGYLTLNFKSGQYASIFAAGTAAVRFQYAGNISTISGGVVTGDDLKLKCNTIDARPFINLYGGAGTLIDQTAGSALEVADGGTVIGNIISGGGGAGGVLHLKETTTPTAVPDFGAIYTKNDNHLYWQSGAGVEYDLGGA